MRAAAENDCAKQRLAAATVTWLTWLRENCPNVSEQTAQRYMWLAARWPELETKTSRVTDLPLRHALALLASPRMPPDAEDRDGINWLAKTAKMEADWRALEDAISDLNARLAAASSIEEAADIADEARDWEARAKALHAQTILDLRTLTRELASALGMPPRSITEPKALQAF